MTLKKCIKFLLGISLTVICLWLIFQHIHYSEIKNALREAQISWIVFAALSFFLGYACRIERWRLMLKQHNPKLNWSNCAGPLMASFAANNVLPFRAGDLLRAFAFNRRLKISTSTSITTLFVERLLDLLMVVMFFGLSLAYFGVTSARFASVSGVFLIILAIVILLVLLYPALFKPSAIVCGRLIFRIFPRLGQKILDEIHKSFLILEHVAKKHIMVRLIGWSIIAWLAEGCVFWFIALALPTVIYPSIAWFAFPIGTLATIIPSAPGAIGTFDYFTIQAMVVFGNTKNAAAAYTLLVHALIWLLPIIAGGLYLLLHPIKPQDKWKIL